MSIFNDHSAYNKFMVTKGYRVDRNTYAVSDYKEQQDLRRKLRRALTKEAKESIVCESADARYQPNTLGELEPLVKLNDFDELINRLNTAKPKIFNGFSTLYELNKTEAFIFLKYPRRFSYLIEQP